jgi:hypothetical protein
MFIPETVDTTFTLKYYRLLHDILPDAGLIHIHFRGTILSE